MSTPKKLIFSLLTSGALLLLVTALLVLNPGCLYANRTATAHYTVYHNRALDPVLLLRLAQARALDQQSSWFDPNLRLNICLNDGSAYPRLVEKLLGPAFGWSVYRSVVLSGEADFKANTLALNGYRWNLVQLLAHEAAHCYQLRRLGPWKMNPFAPQYPMWKLEGYAEYVSRRGPGYPSLRQQVQQLSQAAQATPHEWGLALPDGTTASREYANYLVLTTYCLDVKKLTYQQLLADTTSEPTVSRQVASWYRQGAGQ